MPIDFVIPWVDGNDPEWRAERSRHAAHCGDSAGDRFNDGEQRYRDWGLLKYWFRGVEAFAPWVNRIHFVTWGHVPDWLNVNHPKLQIVNHRDYIPEKWLPTFSSHVIELNLHRIRGLAEQFVYFNDDTFLTAPTSSDDFFRDGLPRDAAIISPIHAVRNGIRAELNDIYVINEHFRKNSVIRKDLGKWFALCYGRSLIRTLLMMPFGTFPGFYVSHLPTSYLKSTFEEVWAKVPEEIERTCEHRFRELSDVNQWLMEYWQFVTGRFCPRSPRFGAMYEGADLSAAAADDIRHQRHKVVCWNDSPDIVDADGVQSMMQTAFDAILPQKSSFEL